MTDVIFPWQALRPTAAAEDTGGDMGLTYTGSSKTALVFLP